MKVLLIDNFDSFTFNLFHYLEAEGAEVTVLRNDEIEMESVPKFDKIVFSPGPGLPAQAGKMMEVIGNFHTLIPMLGVCLGMQALGEFFGGSLYNLSEVKHGKSERCELITESKLFAKIPTSFQVGLYHSWAVDIDHASSLKALAYSENQVLMSFEHVVFPLFGVQFHPESILTEHGKQLIRNFLLL